MCILYTAYQTVEFKLHYWVLFCSVVKLTLFMICIFFFFVVVVLLRTML